MRKPSNILDRKSSMQLKRIAAALTLALGVTQGGYGLAAGESAAKPSAKRPTTQAASEDLLARTVFQALVGEFALQRGDAKLGGK